MFDQRDRVVLVTGAASGIGAAIAAAFAAAGARVVLTDVTESAGQALAEQLRESGHAVEFLRLNVTDEADCANVTQQVLARHGRLDVLVNNAGIGHVGTVLETTGADLDRLYAVNVRGVFNVTKACLPALVERGAGAIINLASIGGVVGVRQRAAYSVTKFAVVGLTKAMALDHSHQGIRVNCICPGRVETPFVKKMLAGYPDPAAAYGEMCATQLTGRMLHPDEVAAAALYLASDAAASVTGTAFIIDGGWSAGK